MSYTPPTYKEARTILKELELSGSKAAEQAGLKNSRSIRRYTSENSSDKMPYSVLFTLITKNIGIFIDLENWREELVEQHILHQ